MLKNSKSTNNVKLRAVDYRLLHQNGDKSMFKDFISEKFKK